MSSSWPDKTGCRSTFALQRIRWKGCGITVATAVCCAFPANPAHATAGAGGAATCAPEGRATRQEPSATPAATEPEDRRSQLVITLRPPVTGRTIPAHGNGGNGQSPGLPGSYTADGFGIRTTRQPSGS